MLSLFLMHVRRTPTASQVRIVGYGLLSFFAIAIVALPELGIAEDAVHNAIATYAKSISLAQSELDQKRVADARVRLNATDESLRGFEYEYLLARANRVTASGDAPHLITKVPKPDVETRYAVLNEFTRQREQVSGGVRHRGRVAIV